MFGNAVHLYAGNRNPGRVWQYGNSTTLAIGTRAACGNRKTRPRVATQHTYTLAIGTRAACGNRKQGRVWQYTLGSPGPVLQRTRRGVRRNRVALTHANYGQRRVWQYTLAISAACGNTRWQSVPRVAMHAGNQKRGPRVAITRLPVPRVAGPMRGSGTTKFIPPRR